jgi:hypothetical protein
VSRVATSTAWVEVATSLGGSNMSDTSLPKQFRDLERFVSEWSLPSEGERNHKRRSSSMELLVEFYDAVLPRFGEILSHLNGVPADGMPADERRLVELSLSFAEVSNAVERFGQPDVPDAIDASRMAPIEGTSGLVPRAVVRREGA